jgi:hypothetical protein
MLALGFEPRRQHQMLTEMLRVLVNRKTRPIRRQLEENPSWLAEVDGLEPEAVNLWRGLKSYLPDLPLKRHLLFGVAHAPRDMVDRAGPPPARTLVG